VYVARWSLLCQGHFPDLGVARMRLARTHHATPWPWSCCLRRSAYSQCPWQHPLEHVSVFLDHNDCLISGMPCFGYADAVVRTYTVPIMCANKPEWKDVRLELQPLLSKLVSNHLPHKPPWKAGTKACDGKSQGIYKPVNWIE